MPNNLFLDLIVDFKIPSENTIGSPWRTVEFNSLSLAFKAIYNLLLQLSILPHSYVNPALKTKQSTVYPVWLSVSLQVEGSLV